MCRRITRKEQKPLRNLSNDIFVYLHKKLKRKYVFTTKLVGSGSYGTMIKDLNGDYDMDYQILLHNKYNLENKNATEIKTDIFGVIQSYISKNKTNCNLAIENSTTAITVTNKAEKYHIDFVIIKTFPNNNLIIRRNNKKETITKNEFTWNELPKYNEAYNKFRKWDTKKKNEFIEYFLPIKIKEKAKTENDITKISSSQLFIREVNNYE